MFSQMRKATGVASILRAVGGVADAPSVAGTRGYLCQSLIESTLTKSKKKRSPWFPLGGAAKEYILWFSAPVEEAIAELDKIESVRKKPPPMDIVLYQYEACPFCNKTKAFLDYYDLPYKIVEVNPISKKEIKWSSYKKVPILMVDGEQMVGSSDIINKLMEKINSHLCAESDEEDSEEKKWLDWVDNHLVHVLSPNIYRSTSEALESFDYITTHGNFSFTERIIAKYGGAAAMYFVSKKLKKRHNITDERAALYEACQTWVDGLEGRDFLGELSPNLADLAVFGVLRPIRHLKSGRDMMVHTDIGDWYDRMEISVGKSSGVRI